MPRTLDRIACALGRRDEVPNQELARELARLCDFDGVNEIASGLRSDVKGVAADCIKVLYEVGYLDPKLVAHLAESFLELLTSRNNRLVWGAMIAITTIARERAKPLYAKRRLLQDALREGSVITVDNGIRALAIVASQKPAYRDALFPVLLEHLRVARPKDVPQHAEHVLVAVDGANRAKFIEAVTKRMEGMPDSRQKRLRRVLREAEGR
ncbi:MAG: hypothetical protein IPH13_15245 [Planctomycetes bacterium]|nr:hypothetical protein [Planctomycetota bacterium]MCC7172127.1 hypothetical protein [Planctomycetota bacterium]